MFNKLFVALLTLSMANGVFAGKVVVVDFEQVILRTKVAQQKIEELKAKPAYAQMMAQMDTINSDLQGLQKEADSKGMTWSTEEKTEHKKKIEYILADRKLLLQKLQSENNAVFASIGELLQPKVQKAVQTYVESNDIDLLLNRQAVHYVKPSSDVTDAIAAEIDKLK